MAVVGAIAAAAVTATAFAAQDGASPRNPPDANVQSKVQTVDQRQAALFSVLRRPQRVGDAVATPMPGPYGANLELARLIQTAAGPVRVVPASGHICLRAMDAVGPVWGCVRTDAAIEGKLILSLRASDSSGQPAERADAVFALFPDQSVGETVTDRAGNRSTISQHENVSGIEDSDAQRLSFADDAGKRHTTEVP